MQKIVISLVVLCSAATCFAATAIGPAHVRETHPNQCYETEKNAYYSPGESWQLENCGLATCTLTNYTGTPQLMVSYASCGTVSVDPPCYLNEDSTASYPECCPQPVCPEGFEPEQSSESTEADAGRQTETADDSENEIEESDNSWDSDNTDVYRYTPVKEDRQSNDLAEKTQLKTPEVNDAENMIGDDDESNFYQTSMEDLQYLDFLPSSERDTRKVSPRFQYLGNPFTSSYSYYQWF